MSFLSDIYKGLVGGKKSGNNSTKKNNQKKKDKPKKDPRQNTEQIRPSKVTKNDSRPKTEPKKESNPNSQSWYQSTVQKKAPETIKRNPNSYNSQAGKNNGKGTRKSAFSISDSEMKRAIKESKQINGLGAKVQTHTDKVKNKQRASNMAAHVAQNTDIASQGKKAKSEGIKEARRLQKKYNLSDAETQKIINSYNKDVDKDMQKKVDKNNKKFDKNNPKYLTNTSKDLNRYDYGKMTVGAMTGKLDDVVKKDKELANKLTDINVRDYMKSAGFVGALDQMTQGQSVSTNKNYKYTKEQKAIMEQQKQTKGYMGGRLVGGAVEFGLGGTGTIGNSVAKGMLGTTGKNVLRNIAKEQGKKALAKEVTKNIAKETAADAVVSLPLNALDATKDSVANGKLDKNLFAKSLAANVAMDIGLGGAVSGIGHGLAGKGAVKFNNASKNIPDNVAKNLDSANKKDLKYMAKNLAEYGNAEDKAKFVLSDSEKNKYASLKAKQSAGRTTPSETKELADLSVKINKAPLTQTVQRLAKGAGDTEIKLANAYDEAIDDVIKWKKVNAEEGRVKLAEAEENAIEYRGLLDEHDRDLPRVKAQAKEMKAMNSKLEELGVKSKTNLVTRAEAKMVLKSMGKDIDDDFDAFVVKGADGKNEIYINASSKSVDPISVRIGHEVSHLLEGHEDYNSVNQLLKEVVGEKNYNAEFEKCRKLYEGIEGADADNEATANLLGKMFSTDKDGNFLRGLSNSNSNLFNKIADFISNLRTSGKTELGNAKINELDDMCKKILRESNTEDVVVGSAKYKKSANTEITYESLIGKKDMVITKLKPLPQNVTNDDIVEIARNSIRDSGGYVNGRYKVRNSDTGNEIIVGKRGLTHGLSVKRSNYSINASIAANIDSYLKNSIKINDLEPRGQNKESYILLGYAEDGVDSYPAYFVINRRETGLTELEDFDTLYSANGKKIEGSVSMDSRGLHSALPSITINIRDLLDKVNELYSDILPKTVAEHYGVTRKRSVLGDSVMWKLSDSDRKQKQLEIINHSNSMYNDTNTGIRSVDDILTLKEAMDDEGTIVTAPDWTEEMIRDSIASGKVTIYSSYPIENGTFVTPSKMEAEQYAGGFGEKVYSKEVSIEDVAWIDTEEGQFAPLGEVDFKLTDNKKTIDESDPEWSRFRNNADEEARIADNEPKEPTAEDIENSATREELEEYEREMELELQRADADLLNDSALTDTVANIRGNHFYLDESQAKELASRFDGFQNAKKHFFGRNIHITKDQSKGASLDSRYADLVERARGHLKETTDPVEQLDEMYRLVDTVYEGKRAEKTIEKADVERYYNNKKEVDSYDTRNRQMGQETVSSNRGGEADIRETNEGISERPGDGDGRVNKSDRKEKLGRVGMGNSPVKSEIRNKMNEQGIVDTNLSSSDHASFSASLDEGRNANKYGGYVDAKSVDELKEANAKTFLSDDKSVGIAVESDGNIVGAFNAGGKYKGAVDDMLVVARANGGDKMDCYGIKLVRKYEKIGYVPVARVKFNAEYVDKIPLNKTLLDNKPDIYFMMKNSDDIDSVIANMENYKRSSQDELDKLPLFEGENAYDEALAYRDKLLAEQERKATELNSKSSNNTDEPVVTTSKKTQSEPNGDTSKAKPTEADYKMMIDRGQRTTSKSEMNESARKKINEQIERYGGEEKFIDAVTEYTGQGMFGKAINTLGKDEATPIAKKEIKDSGFDEAFEKFMRSEITQEDPKLTSARARELLAEINALKKSGARPDDELYSLTSQVIEKTSAMSNWSARALQAMKDFTNATPEGRVRNVKREIARLETRYRDLLGGRNIEIDDDKLMELVQAEGKEKDRILDEINNSIWEQIPVGWLTKMNELRHCFMLFNPKTHLRNIIGNTVFKSVRTLSDEIESAILNTSPMKKQIEARGGTVDKVHVKRSEMAQSKGLLRNEFEAIYKDSGSRSQYLESVRPSGVPTFKWKGIQKLVDTNYKFLEDEDVKLCLRPEFEKSYTSWCKSKCPKDVDLKEFMEKLPEEDKIKARQYALTQGEYATFRDSCYLSSLITKKKQVWADKKGNTIFGTAMYRTGHLMLEGTLPFVKTPINIARRSIDYSPIAIARSFAKMGKSADADQFKSAIHDMATGLTGTGIMAVGMLACKQGLVTVKAGEESGDAFYDRDMGYQDYSLQINAGNKTFSASMDWVAPVQVSFFMGAATYNALEAKLQGKLEEDDILNVAWSLTAPFTDMSFMSSPMDTVNRFVENATKESSNNITDSNFGNATVQLLLGDLPQNYVSGFIPQSIAQTSGVFDNVKRDTRSTADSTFAKSWETTGRQLINKVPGLRNYFLKPKVDRFGEDVQTGGNIATRMFMSYILPSNVKEITKCDRDMELIKIRNGMKDKASDDYKYFFYNFTGNPAYDLSNGKRMTYDEAYEYGKSKRINQTKMVDSMIHSKSYKNMNNDMRSTEVSDMHWISTTVADRKTYGDKYALDTLIQGDRRNKEREAFISYRDLAISNGKNAKSVRKTYLDYYVNKETMLTRSHASGDDTYRIKALTAIQTADKELLKSLDIHDSKLKDIKMYMKKVREEVKKKGGNAKNIAFTEITDSYCNVESKLIKSGIASTAKGVKSSAAGLYAGTDSQISERAYRAMGFNWNGAQSGAGLVNKHGYTLKQINSMKAELGSTPKKAEVIAYIDKLKPKSKDEAACLYEVLYNGGRYRNPYKAQIADHLKWNENNDDEWGTGSSGGRGYRHHRRGYGHHGGGGGGRGGSKDWMAWYNSNIAVSGSSGSGLRASKQDYKSPLTEAYRRRQRAKQMAVKGK